MELSLKDIDMKELVSKAIFDSLDEKKKEDLLKTALQNVLAPNSSLYSRNSALQDAFNEAVRIKSREILLDKLEKDEGFKNEVNRLIADVMDKVFNKRREEVIDKMVEGFMYVYTKQNY